jgi:hypothetical protein
MWVERRKTVATEPKDSMLPTPKLTLRYDPEPFLSLSHPDNPVPYDTGLNPIFPYPSLLSSDCFPRNFFTTLLHDFLFPYPRCLA